MANQFDRSNSESNEHGSDLIARGSQAGATPARAMNRRRFLFKPDTDAMKSLKPKLISSLVLLSRLSWARLIAVSLSAFAATGSTYSASLWPGDSWPAATAAEQGLDSEKLEQARDYALTAGGSGHIIHQGKLVLGWGDPATRYDLKSTTKSIGVTLLGIALKDGKVKLEDSANKYHPSFGVPPESNAETGWLDTITLRMLADQAAGFDKRGGYEPLLFKPGAEWSYSDGGPNWLAECLTLAYKRDLNEVMFERVFTPLGIKPSDLRWRNNQFRPHDINGVKRREFGSGIHASVDAMARIGYLYLREGRWAGEQILPPAFIQAVRNPDPALAQLPTRRPEDYGRASQHYSILWWNNRDGTIAGAPRDAYWSWGLHDSLIVVIPSLDLVIARAGPTGTGWKRVKGADHYEVLKPFLEPIAAAVPAGTPRREAEASNPEPKPPYPSSSFIQSIVWAPKEEIIRQARGSDNWPITWADDNNLYTAYGDGWGFDPRVPEKLSLGFAKVMGTPPDFQGVNIRSASGEDKGDGARGKKASGMLMVDGVLYMWVRNAGNSQLAWSTDYARSWTWADWKFTESFGAPTFLNFGKNYAGARDEYVYIYSFDSDSAYVPADRMVLARAPKDRLRERGAYEFFVELNAEGQPVWSGELSQRGPVFTHPGRCYRSGISYNAALKRYLWCQILPESSHPQGVRFQGGFGVYEAPEPWGPWRTVFFTNEWDVGPGESSSFPTKWMSADGRTLHLLFSGDDYFAVREARLLLKSD
jgi:CubicO group peptidase (beta-lactamase class C family)